MSNLGNKKTLGIKNTLRVTLYVRVSTDEQAFDIIDSFGDILERGDFHEIRSAIESLIDFIELDDDITIHWKFAWVIKSFANASVTLYFAPRIDFMYSFDNFLGYRVIIENRGIFVKWKKWLI